VTTICSATVAALSVTIIRKADSVHSTVEGEKPGAEMRRVPEPAGDCTKKLPEVSTSLIARYELDLRAGDRRSGFIHYSPAQFRRVGDSAGQINK
jgi:hypothetical protein